MAWSRTASNVYADGPGSQPYEPAKSEIRALLSQYESAIDGLTSMLGANQGAVKGTKADLDAVLGSFSNGAVGIVFADTEELKGIYLRTSGGWVKQSPLPGYAADAASAAAMAYRDAALVYRNQAAEFTNGASVAAAAASSSAVAASNEVTAAANYAAAASAAASTTGPALIVATKSEADARIGELANLGVVEVQVDETFGNFRTRYRKESGALVRRLTIYDYLRPAEQAGRNLATITVPYLGDYTFIDNVLAVQNKSVTFLEDGVTKIAGNAAINFLDKAGTERAAIGYSRNSALAPNAGYYPELLYNEIGNPFTTDGNITSWAVVLTVKPGGPYFSGAGVGYFPIRVEGSTGEISFRSPFEGWTTFHDKVRFGTHGEQVVNIEYTMFDTAARFRESGYSNQFAIGVNDYTMDKVTELGQDNGALPSWFMTMGPGLDYFSINRAPAGSGLRANYKPLLRIDGQARTMINQDSSSAGIDGQLSVVSAAGGRSTATFKGAGTAATPVQLLWNSAASGDNQFLAFATEASYTARGSVSYNRGSGTITYGTTSDRRAKDIHGGIEDAVERLMEIKTYRGRMHGAEADMDLVIADELQEIAPYAVTGEPDAVRNIIQIGEDGQEMVVGSVPDLQQVDLAKLVPLLISGFQQQQRRIEELEVALASRMA